MRRSRQESDATPNMVGKGAINRHHTENYECEASIMSPWAWLKSPLEHDDDR